MCLGRRHTDDTVGVMTRSTYHLSFASTGIIISVGTSSSFVTDNPLDVKFLVNDTARTERRNIIPQGAEKILQVLVGKFLGSTSFFGSLILLAKARRSSHRLYTELVLAMIQCRLSSTIIGLQQDVVLAFNKNNGNSF
jgi:hypothetical protein